MKHIAFTKRFDTLVSALVTKVEIINPNDTEKSLIVDALWDTGSTVSAISQELVEDLELTDCYPTIVKGISSVSETYKFPVFLRLSETSDIIAVQPCMVDSIPSFPRALFLVGMDIISKGNFAISNENGHTVFSFMIPSAFSVDFVQQIRDLKRKF